MQEHIKVLGVLNIVVGALGLCGALVILAFFGGLAGISATEAGASPADDSVAVFGVIGGVAFFFLTIISAPSLIAGVGLVKFQPWARTFGIVVSILHLLNIPIGTALGVYGLWVLFKDESAVLLKAKHPSLSPSR
jgi:hypothetical protein